MSVIDSGLGWKCDSDYFVNEADAELAIVSTDTAYKALQGAAITAQITNGNSTQLFLISTAENNAKLKMNSSLRTVYSVSVGGETWYISMSYMSDSVTSDYPLITASKGETLNDVSTENLIKVIMELTEAADVVLAKKIPTVNYIHQYVEGVEAETVNRVNAVKNMITPVFNAQTVYAVGDYCIYNNGLYKCTTAHSGAWSANDFTSVSVMDEIKNASGGGGLPETTKIVTFEYGVDDLSQPKTVAFPKYGDTGIGKISFFGNIQQYYSINNSYPNTVMMKDAPLYHYLHPTLGNRKYTISNIAKENGCYSDGSYDHSYIRRDGTTDTQFTISINQDASITITVTPPTTTGQRLNLVSFVIDAIFT